MTMTMTADDNCHVFLFVGFCVAYHLIPAGAMNGAIIIYEANAVLAELLYGVDHFQAPPFILDLNLIFNICLDI